MTARDAAQLMDSIYHRQRHLYDATRKFYLLGRDALIAELAVPPGGSVLEVGCGTGRNLVKAARAYPGSACYGIDVSAAMLATARGCVRRAGLESRIRLAQADATNFDPWASLGRDSFDRVVISYALSMIPPWQAVLRQATALLAPGGSLHLVDFGDQAGLPPLFKTALERWLALFHVVPRATLAQDVAALAASERLRACVRPRYRGYAIAARLERTG